MLILSCLLQEVKEKLRKQQASAVRQSVTDRVTELGNSIRSGLGAGNQANGFFGNALTNLVVIVGFAAFM